MKKISLSLILATFCFIVNAQFNSEKDPFIVKSLKDESFTKIDAETSHGNISVSVVSAAEARIEVYVRSNNNNQRLSKEEIQKRLDENYSLEVAVAGSELSAIAKQKRDFSDWKKSLGISFRIFTAKGMPTHLRTSHGNIDLQNMEGTQDMATSHGNISIENANGKLSGNTSHGNISIRNNRSTGDVDFSTSHGNIDAANCTGDVKLITSNGNVQIKNLKGKIETATSHGDIRADIIEGELSASTSHGNVSLDNLSCSVEASTSHGNIDVSLKKVVGRVDIDDSDGNISLEIPKGSAVDLDLQGKKINVGNIDNFSGSKEDNAVKGTLNGGGVKVRAKNGRGTVSLTVR